MSLEKNTEEKQVVDCVIKFLNSDKQNLMNYCYSSIRSNQDNRYFRDTINIVNNDEFDSLFPLVSLVVLTANKVECDSLNYVVSKQKGNDLKKRKEAIKIFENVDWGAPDAYLFKMHSVYILHLHAYETGANTPGGSTDLVRFVSNNPFIKPLCIISFGICYGRDPHNQNIGDVLIPKKLYPWSIGQKIGDKGLSIKHDNFNFWLEDKFPGSGIYPILNNFCNGEDGRILTDSIELKKENRKNEKKCVFSIKVVWGSMSTGEAVVSSQKAKKEIQEATNNEKELGGEMEGYGIAKECIYYAKVPCFIVKAICDWGVCKDIDKKLEEKQVLCPENLKDRLQAYAAFCASIALLQLLNSEKEKLLSLDIIKWMGRQRGKNSIKLYDYVKKDVIIGNIKKYYRIDEKIAYKILRTFTENNIFKVTEDGYRINI
ncbi:MAG: hypothetical protein K2O32_01620 [Acetatifactor sp.]|nr:hypothetical protein [Acetatifactor sp.]